MFLNDLFPNDDKAIAETIRKVKGGYRLVSHSGKNLGTYPTHAGAEKREKQVNYFKHTNESASNFVSITQDGENGSLEGYVVDTSMPQIRNYLSSQGAAQSLIDKISNKFSKICVLRNLYVEDDYRNQGIGRELVNNAIHAAFLNDAEAIILVADTSEDNSQMGKSLEDWYKSWGFKTVGHAGNDPVMLLQRKLSNEDANSDLAAALEKTQATSYDAIDKLMKSIAKQHNITPEELHDLWVKKYDKTPDDWIKAKLDEGPTWDKVKNAATAGIAAGALGYGALTGQFTGKEQPAKAPLEINIPGGDIKQEPKAAKPAVQLEPSTATNANQEMEQLVFLTAFRAGLKGKELAQFMAQTAHETLGFQRLAEVGNKEYFKRYDPTVNPAKAKILGNTEKGDGIKYRGRGFIQLTGRDNYKRAGKALRLPLEEKPQLVSHPKVAAQVAVWFWKTHVRGDIRDFTDTISVTSKVNPSMNGLGDRDMNFQHYMQRLAPMVENFADGKKPGRKGLAKRVGVNCKQSVTKLRKIAKNSSGEKQRMAHWCANMKGGKKK